MRVNNGVTTGSLDYGAGGNGQFPQAGRWIKFYNGTGADMFVPDNSRAEQISTYNYVGSIPGVTQWKGQAGDSSYVYVYTAIWGDYGGYVCWSPYYPGSYRTPDACPSGWTDLGVYNSFVDPNNFYGNGTLSNTDGGWMFYQVYGWGCGAPFRLAASGRACRK